MQQQLQGLQEPGREGTWGAEWNRGRLKLMVIGLGERRILYVSRKTCSKLGGNKIIYKKNDTGDLICEYNIFSSRPLRQTTNILYTIYFKGEKIIAVRKKNLRMY